MSHLNEQLSALVDSELTGTELDRVNAHLAACEPCRAEAAALRVLKRELRSLATTRPTDDLTRRLLAMAGPGGPVPPRRQWDGLPRPRPVFRAYPDRPGSRSSFADRPAGRRPGPHSPADAWARRRRGRSLAWGALSFVVSVGLGAAALSIGGVDLSLGSRNTPQMELNSIEHAFVSGSIPLFGPAQSPAKLKPSWGPSHPLVTPTP